ncbi:DUF6927 domain-containing protein [Bradyrhizobium elkanii]|uniref:DUF6927 domain-containing protein n=1 Tax=Bradyrhizobium elkanii TaxID=29448 RepID=UPI003514D720
MGWLYMQSLGGYSGPRQYLDAQFTFTRSDVTSKVLRSAPVAIRVYYAAVETLRLKTYELTVWAAVCLVRYNPRDREGYIFGYKDMDETLGPNEADCPQQILDLLTPTDRPYAQGWRARCRENAMARRALSRKPSPRPGQTIVFEEALLFSNGCRFDRFEVVADPRSHRSVLYREPQHCGLYRIPNVKKRPYRLIGSTQS